MKLSNTRLFHGRSSHKTHWCRNDEKNCSIFFFIHWNEILHYSLNQNIPFGSPEPCMFHLGSLQETSVHPRIARGVQPKCFMWLISNTGWICPLKMIYFVMYTSKIQPEVSTYSPTRHKLQERVATEDYINVTWQYWHEKKATLLNILKYFIVDWIAWPSVISCNYILIMNGKMTVYILGTTTGLLKLGSLRNFTRK